MLYVKLPITPSVGELCDDSFIDGPSFFHLLQLQEKTATNITIQNTANNEIANAPQKVQRREDNHKVKHNKNVRPHPQSKC